MTVITVHENATARLQEVREIVDRFVDQTQAVSIISTDSTFESIRADALELFEAGSHDVTAPPEFVTCLIWWALNALAMGAPADDCMIGVVEDDGERQMILVMRMC